MIKTLQYLLLFAALISFNSLYSQGAAFKGKVVNKNSQKPLENVEILNRYGSILKRTLADGTFTLNTVSVKTGDPIYFRLGDFQTSFTIDNTWKNKEVQIELDVKVEREIKKGVPTVFKVVVATLTTIGVLSIVSDP